MKKYPWWKALIDYSLSLIAIFALGPLFLLLLIICSIDTGFPGIFIQERIGLYGEKFKLFKFRTYHPDSKKKSKIGSWMRKSKLDELPQLFNILKGDMSLVGPRPDIPGYYDLLKGENRLVLNLKPGLTSDASILFRDEENTLSNQKNPLLYNDEVLFPEKVKMNLNYYYNLSFKTDINILFKTVFVFFK